MLLSRKADAMKMDHEGDDGMMHAIFAQLPSLVVEETPVEESECDGEGDTRSRHPSESALTISPQSQTPRSSELSPDADDDDTLLEESNINDDDERTIIDHSEVMFTEKVPPKSGVPHRPSTEQSTSGGEAPDNPWTTPIPLTTLLKASDDLYTRFPPVQRVVSTDPEKSSRDLSSARSLNVSEVFGPTSVVFTWTEDMATMLTDDEAERIVSDGLVNVVLPSDDQSDTEDTNEWEKTSSIPGSENEDREQAMKRRRLVTSAVGISAAVLVGLAAIVLYSVDRSISSREGKSFKEWHQAAALAGGVVLDLGEWIVGGL
jgi:hypothetical protein